MNSTSILSPVVHGRLIADMDHLCQVAGVPAHYVHQSAKSFCADSEIEWVRHFHKLRATRAGLVLVGKENADSRCLAICGALMRAFIDARVRALNTILNDADTGDQYDSTVLLVPNAFVNSVGKSLPAWKTQQFYDVLLRRMAQNKPTVLAVESMEGLAQAYGGTFANHLKSHYEVV